MKIGFLYDSTDAEARILFERLRAAAEEKADTIAVIDTAAGSAAACICCFQCWTKTPGECMLPRDNGTQFPEKFWDAAYVVVISRILWGGYSTAVKSYMDRIIPILHPYFVKRNGEMHHKLRYDSMPLFLSAGYGARTAAEEATFRAYTAANRDQGGFVCDEGTFIVGHDDDAARAAKAGADWLAAEISKEIAR